jgi:hypothetical protein
VPTVPAAAPWQGPICEHSYGGFANRLGPQFVTAIAAALKPEDAALFRQMYASRAKDRATAWVLEIFLSPTIAYLYLGEWVLAIVSLITVQGFLIWWVIGWFATGSWTDSVNKRIATEIASQIRLMRP